MRVEPGHRDARAPDPEARNLVGGEIAEEASRQQPRHLGERHVHGGEHHLERLGPEHHRDTRRARQLRQQIGVSLPRQPGAGKPQLVHGRGCDRRHASIHRVANGRTDRVIRRVSGFRGQYAGLEARTVRGAVDDRLTRLANARIVRRLPRDLGADARGITDRDRDPRFHSSSSSQSATTFGLALRSSAVSARSTAA